MYLLFRYHHILPRQYYDADYGEKAVMRAFIHKDIEDRKKEQEEMEKEYGK